MSVARGGGIIYLYSSDITTLVNSFPSARKAAEFYNCSHHTIIKYAKSGEIFQSQWILSTML